MSENGLLSAIIADYLHAVDAGQQPNQDELLARYPDQAEQLRAFFATQAQIGRIVSQEQQDSSPVTQLGAYEVLEEIGRGGMGVVYKARHRELDRTVALKRLVGGANPSGGSERLRQEAEILARLDHPHIVPVYEVGEQDGRPFFAMKLIEGTSLADQLPQLRGNRRELIRLLVVVARAVQFAHEQGVVHRDLKPANVLLNAQGEVFVSDFGLARRLEADPGLTASGALVGTPSYMAPEQATGEKGVGPAVDVWALGVILYEALTGRLPFAGETPLETLHKIVGEDVVPPRRHDSTIDKTLERICLRCLEQAPQRRYSSAGALADDLERWLNGEPLAGPRSWRPRLRLRRLRSVLRRRLRWGMPAVAVLLAGAWVVYCNYAGSRQVARAEFALEGNRRQVNLLEVRQPEYALEGQRGQVNLAEDALRRIPVGGNWVLLGETRKRYQRLVNWTSRHRYDVPGMLDWGQMGNGIWSVDGERFFLSGGKKVAVEVRTEKTVHVSSSDPNTDRPQSIVSTQWPNILCWPERANPAIASAETLAAAAVALQGSADSWYGSRNPGHGPACALLGTDAYLLLPHGYDWFVGRSQDQRFLYFFKVSVGQPPVEPLENWPAHRPHLVQATYDRKDQRWVRLVAVGRPDTTNEGDRALPTLRVYESMKKKETGPIRQPPPPSKCVERARMHLWLGGGYISPDGRWLLVHHYGEGDAPRSTIGVWAIPGG
jgi:predicted Ser/Thr protein kinase